MTHTLCKICHQPVTATIPPMDQGPISESIVSAMLRQIAPNLVHDRCFDDWKERRFQANEAALLVKRQEEWENLCPPIYQDTKIEQIPNQTALKKAMQWVYSPRGMVFGGVTGRGKTRTMWLVLRQLWMDGKFVAATTHTDFAAKATLANWHGNQSIVRWIKLLTDADILFVDDFGKSRFKTADGNSRAAEEVLFSILESRWTHKLPCMFTTNATSESIRSRMSDDVAGPFLRRLKDFQESIEF